MTSDEKARFDAFETLRQAAWNNFDHRRSYEWKLAISLWTALAAFTGAVITRPTDPALPAVRGSVWLVAVGGLAVTLIHAYWSYNCKVRNDRDRKLSYLFEEKMCTLLSVSYADVLGHFVDAHPRRAGSGEGLWNYWHASQVAMTFVLSVGATVATWARVA
jgi:hypothetical protein